MSQHVVFRLDLDDTFKESFGSGGAPVLECYCGKTHVAIDSDCFDESDEEDMEIVASYKKQAEENDNVILHYDDDYLEYMDIMDRVYVKECECEGWKGFMNFIIDHRTEIKDFLIEMAEKAEYQLEKERVFKKLSEISVIDDIPF